MATIIEVTDLSMPELEPFTRLTEAQLRNRLEPEKGIFIAESPKVILRALDAGYEPVSLLMEHRQITGQGSGVLARCADIPVYTASRELLAELTGYPLTRGVLCAMRRPKLPSVEELCADARGWQCWRGSWTPPTSAPSSAPRRALNMDAVLVTPTCSDPLYRRAVRVSMGTIFQVPWTRIGEEPSQWPDAGLQRLRSLGFRTAAMALSDDSVSIEDPRAPGGGTAGHRVGDRGRRTGGPHHRGV